MQDLPEYSLPEAAQYLSDRLEEPYLVEHIESLIKFGEILACVNPGWRLLYLPPGSYGLIKKGQPVAAAKTLDDLRNNDWVTFPAGRLCIEDVVVQREVLDAYVKGQLKPTSPSTNEKEIVPDLAGNGSHISKWEPVKPKRIQGYNRPLYELIMDAHKKGKAPPSTYDVFLSWKEKRPPEIITVEPNLRSLTYQSGGARPQKRVSANAISKAIKRMTRAV